ncbi:hypothetical protein AC622_16305 [Bacillus sp. FJAT-27916]|uniref:B3/B4 domain-containing protein n=1 Tax=Bacillus sp. FJAT-27916 TaxID=1679169 RepID=UPI000670BD1D|nr:phenylalanine--tRNA ligase beta subunit-related protein [Bacillus sp. FJAT-27916]KMY45588.1 hypothetical protein AC622_16305 [Bacillus sp. FJAT-27916]
MIHIKADEQLFAQAGDVKFGIIHYEGMEAGNIPSMLVGRLQLYIEQLHTELQMKEWADYPGITAWRKIFKKTGADPSKYRPSAEALYRRIKKEPSAPTGNSSIALNNFFSLQYKIPLGIYDVKAIKGDVHIKIGSETDRYEGLNGRTNTLNRIIGTFDEEGVFGSPYVDSVRTSIQDDTKDALQVVYFHHDHSIEQAGKMLEAISKMFIQVHGGDSSIYLVSHENQKIDI